MNICVKTFDAQILIFWQNDSFVNLAIFSCFQLNKGYACA